MRRVPRLIIRLAIAASAVVMVSCAGPAASSASSERPESVRVVDRRVVMGVPATITTWAPNEARAREASRAAFARMAALEQVISDYRSRSESMLAVRARLGEEEES